MFLVEMGEERHNRYLRAYSQIIQTILRLFGWILGMLCADYAILREVYSMDFEVYPLSDELIFVRWHRNPTPVSQDAYLYELEVLLDAARHRLYMISDVSEGQLSDKLAKQYLAKLHQHPHWGGCVSFGQAAVADGAGRRRAPRSLSGPDASVRDVEDALDYLEGLKPGITAHSIDRQALETLYG